MRIRRFDQADGAAVCATSDSEPVRRACVSRDRETMRDRARRVHFGLPHSDMSQHFQHFHLSAAFGAPGELGTTSLYTQAQKSVRRFSNLHVAEAGQQTCCLASGTQRSAAQKARASALDLLSAAGHMGADSSKPEAGASYSESQKAAWPDGDNRLRDRGEGR